MWLPIRKQKQFYDMNYCVRAKDVFFFFSPKVEKNHHQMQYNIYSIRINIRFCLKMPKYNKKNSLTHIEIQKNNDDNAEKEKFPK